MRASGIIKKYPVRPRFVDKIGDELEGIILREGGSPGYIHADLNAGSYVGAGRERAGGGYYVIGRGIGLSWDDESKDQE
jgi:hypothetical protein